MSLKINLKNKCSNKECFSMKSNRNLLNNLPEEFYQFQAYLGRVVFGNRMEQMMTQEELANRAGFDVEIIAKIEGGFNTDIPIGYYTSIFKVLNLTPLDVGRDLVQLSKGENAESKYPSSLEVRSYSDELLKRIDEYYKNFHPDLEKESSSKEILKELQAEVDMYKRVLGIDNIPNQKM